MYLLPYEYTNIVAKKPCILAPLGGIFIKNPTKNPFPEDIAI